MNLIRRRITLQLTPLLDLLLIIIFAQYMEMQQKFRQQESELKAKESVVVQAEKLVNEARERWENAAHDAERERAELATQLERALSDKAGLGKLLAEALQLPPEMVEKALKGKTEAQINEIRKSLATLPKAKSTDVVHELVVLAELKRNCDVWEIHIDGRDLVHITAGEEKSSFRAETAKEFERQFFLWANKHPSRKSLVLGQLTWGDASYGVQQAAKEGLVRAMGQLRQERLGRTIYEYVVLGFHPE